MAWLGGALQARGQLEEASEVYQEALRVNPANGRALRGMAQLAELRSDAVEFEKYLDLCIRWTPNDPWVQRKRRERDEERDPKAAIAKREKQREGLAKDGPEYLENLKRLASLYYADKQPAKTEQCLIEANTLHPTDTEIGWRLAMYYALHGDPKKGEAVLKQLVRATEDLTAKAQAQLTLARFYRTRRMVTDADDAYKVAATIAETEAV